MHLSARSTWIALALGIPLGILGVPSSQTAHGQHQTQRGATLGGLAGAVAGGLIGENNGKAGRGAVIGGALGAVTGGLLGNAADKDAELARRQAYQHHWQQEQWRAQQQASQALGAVSVQDVISMSRSGLGDQVIINQIRARGVQRTPQVSDIIAMHEQGVRETVIAAMQEGSASGSGGLPSPATAPPPPAPSQVIIHEREVLPYYPVPRYYGPHPYYYRVPLHPRQRSAYEFRLGF